VQNSMAELWALLHFIMPMLFDSHDEFAEWFSKDIENVAENKGSIDESNKIANTFPQISLNILIMSWLNPSIIVSAHQLHIILFFQSICPVCT
jgi:SNF2 family DNA or RNA helicase